MIFSQDDILFRAYNNGNGVKQSHRLFMTPTLYQVEEL